MEGFVHTEFSVPFMLAVQDVAVSMHERLNPFREKALTVMDDEIQIQKVRLMNEDLSVRSVAMLRAALRKLERKRERVTLNLQKGLNR